MNCKPSISVNEDRETVDYVVGHMSDLLLTRIVQRLTTVTLLCQVPPHAVPAVSSAISIFLFTLRQFFNNLIL